MEGNAAPPLGGRDPELAALGHALVTGEPALVVGAAGMGKTTVVQAAAHQVGRLLARGASLHFLESTPLLGITRALGAAVEAGDPVRAATVVADLLGDRTLFLDDLQWADGDTIAVLPLLAAHVPLVAAVRPGEGAFDAVVGALDGLALRLDLGPLDGAAAAGVIRHWRPAAAPSEVDQLLTVTGGNPLLLKLAALRHSRVAEAPVAAVVASCSDAARLALARLAIAPGSVPAGAAGVAELQRRSLAHVDGRGVVQLAGDLLGEQALAALPPHVRRQLHTERATVTDDLGEASVHWRLAGDERAAFTASLAAADQAASPLARALHLTAAFDLAPADRTWDLARQACDAWLRLGQLHRIEAIIETAERAGPCPVTAPDWELMLAQLALDRHDPATTLSTVETALGRFPDMGPDYQCWLTGLRAAARGLLLDIDRALADAADAVDLGVAAGVSTGPARLIIGSIELLAGRDGWRTELAAVFAGAAHDDPPVAFEAAMMLLTGHYHHGEVAEGDRVALDLIDLADRTANLGWDRKVRATRAIYRAFRADGGDQPYRELCDLLGDPATFNVRPAVAAAVAIIEIDRGDLDAARATLRRRGLGPGGAASAELAWAAAELAWAGGDPARCRAEVARAADEPWSPTSLAPPQLAVLARWVAFEAGEPTGAVPPPLALFPSQAGLVAEADAIDRWAAGDPTGAVAGFEAAAQQLDPHLFRAAVRCRWAAAGARADGGDPGGALAALDQLWATASEAGMASLARRIDATRRRWAGPGRSPSRPVDAPVTRRQREVLDLVRDGLTTREIAVVLGLSPTTVDTHIRQAMRTLHARSRMEAALRLQRL